MKRQKSQSVIARNQALLGQIKELKIDHPLRGYRRIRSYLKYRQGVPAGLPPHERIRLPGYQELPPQGQMHQNAP